MTLTFLDVEEPHSTNLALDGHATRAAHSAAGVHDEEHDHLDSPLGSKGDEGRDQRVERPLLDGPPHEKACADEERNLLDPQTRNRKYALPARGDATNHGPEEAGAWQEHTNRHADSPPGRVTAHFQLERNVQIRDEHKAEDEESLPGVETVATDAAAPRHHQKRRVLLGKTESEQ